MITVLVVVLGYLLGSLQFGIILSHLFGKTDPRKSGSGNTGATNVARSSGMKIGLLVLLADALKGMVAVWIGYLFGLSELGAALAGLAVVLTFSAPAALIAVVVMMVVLAICQYVSLGSIIATFVATIYMGLTHSGYYMLPIILIAILIIWRHSDNIARLLKGQESKFKFGGKQ